ncbi:MAG TPA: hypothetical protein DCM08_04935 [Microscillaceae bacterium]|jgi:hypothetical protein|nr:hypothetical protein [Microscillaceae bacterium]
MLSNLFSIDRNQNALVDWWVSVREKRAFAQVLKRLKAQFQPDETFALQHQALIRQLREEGVVFLPKHLTLPAGMAETLKKQVETQGYFCDNVQTWYPRSFPEPLSAYLQNSFVRQIIAHARGYDSPVNISRFYLSETLNEVNGSFLWHHDALFDYYKAMVYLTDVTDADGPFEYALGSHRKWWTYYSYQRSRFTDQQVSRFTCKRFTGQVGDLMIFNANGIHRAANPQWGRWRLVLSTAFIDFKSDESTDHAETQHLFR